MTNPSIAKRKTERDLRIIELATNNPNITAAQIGELVQYGRDLVFRVLKLTVWIDLRPATTTRRCPVAKAPSAATTILIANAKNA